MKYNILALLIISSFFFNSCQSNTTSPTNNESTERVDTSKTSHEEEKVKDFFIAIVGDLRVRNIPDVEADVIGKLAYGQKVLYLNEESDFKEKIKLRGKVKYDSWKKVQVEKSSSGEKVEGWVYGGALIKESEIYTKKENGAFERKVISATNKEISELLNFEIDDDFYYDGIIRYKRDNNGDYIKEGKFKLNGSSSVEISKNFDFEIVTEITGNYNNGLPNGIFEKSFGGYENSSVTTINFEKGTCLWSSIMGSGEGEDYNHREESPKDCTFKYIENRLVEVNEWN